MTQVKIAQVLGLGPTTWRFWESGRYPVPSWMQILLLDTEGAERRRIIKRLQKLAG